MRIYHALGTALGSVTTTVNKIYKVSISLALLKGVSFPMIDLNNVNFNTVNIRAKICAK